MLVMFMHPRLGADRPCNDSEHSHTQACLAQDPEFPFMYWSEGGTCLCGYNYYPFLNTCNPQVGGMTYAIAPATCPVTRV